MLPLLLKQGLLPRWFGPLVERSLDATKPASFLTDCFDDNSRDTAFWNSDHLHTSGAANGGDVTEANGRVEVQPVNIASTRHSGYTSVSYYDLRNSSAFVKMTPSAALPASQQAWISVGLDKDNNYLLILEGTTFTWYKQVGGGLTNYGTLASYTTAAYNWIRMREAGGTIFFDTAPSTASDPPIESDWTNRLSGASNGANPAMLKLAFGSGTYANTTPVRIDFDGFNVATTPATSNAISGTTSLTLTGSATLLGSGAIAGSSTLLFSPSATLTGTGAITGSSTLTFTPTATLTGKGAIAGSSTLVFAPSGTLLGSGAISGSSTLSFAPSATLLGKGAVVGSSSLSFAPSGTVTGKGAISGTTSLSFAASATVAVADAISGSTSLSFSPSGTITGRGQVSGSTSVSFVLAGLVTGRGALSGSTSASFTVVGLLSSLSNFFKDASPPGASLTPDTAPAVASLILGSAPDLVELGIVSAPSTPAFVKATAPPTVDLEGE